jgi:hypothetical protein
MHAAEHIDGPVAAAFAAALPGDTDFAKAAAQRDAIENTVRYLGVDIDDALTLSERTEI